MNSDAQPRRSTGLRKKAYELPAGISLELPASATLPTAQRRTSAQRTVLPSIRKAFLSLCQPPMPRSIGGYHLPRSSTRLIRPRALPTSGQGRATRSGYSSSSRIPPSAISFAIFYGTTFAKKTLRSILRFKISNASSISPRPPAAVISIGRNQNEMQLGKPILLVSRRWNNTTSRSFSKRIRSTRSTLPQVVSPS